MKPPYELVAVESESDETDADKDESMLRRPNVERMLLVVLLQVDRRLARCCSFCRRDGIAVKDKRLMMPAQVMK